MKWIKLYEEFQLGDLNFMSPKKIQDLFFEECKKQTPDLNLIRVILDNGLVDVNAKYYGNSPLHYAAYRDNVALAKLLISAGADVNSKNKLSTPLHLAAQENNVALAKLLISAGADVNVKNDYRGKSPLHVAVDWGNIALAELLISAGADVNAKDKWNVSPLAMAVRGGYVGMQDLLKRNGAVE